MIFWDDQFQDYKQYAVTGSLSDNPRLERSVNLFNGLTQWVQCMVLSRSTPQQRAEVIVKLIDVTKVHYFILMYLLLFISLSYYSFYYFSESLLCDN